MLAASTYIQRYFGMALGQATDQQKVAAIIAALRDWLLGNFVSPNLSPRGVGQDQAFASELAGYDNGHVKMMAIIANAINNTNRPGFKIQCTETAAILTFMLNGFGICAREWDVVFRYDLSPGYEVPTVDPDGQTLAGIAAPQHGTVEYFDTQLGKWVFVDLLYGVAGVINNTVANSYSNICGVTGMPMSLPEFIFALSNNQDFPVLWTRRNVANLSDADRWYRVRPAAETYLANFDPNGNAAMQPTFMATSGTAYTQYVTRRIAS